MYLYIGIDNLFTVKGKHRVSKKKRITRNTKTQDGGGLNDKERNISQIYETSSPRTPYRRKTQKEAKRSTKKTRRKKMGGRS